MFNHKKFLAALLCTPLFTACVISGDDSDDVGNTETETNGNTLTTTVGTDDSSGSLTTTVGTEESGSGETVADSSSSDEGSTGEPTGGFCQVACTEAADCCTEGDKACAADPAVYPYTWSCDAGACNYAGCSDDAECDSTVPGWVCSQVDGIGFCEAPCTVDADCVVPGQVCLDDGEGGLTCQPGPCTDSADCGVEGAICEDDGTCTYPGCETDADCTLGVCDVATGFCGCADDAECGEGYICGE